MHTPKSTAEISPLLGNTIIGAAAHEVACELEFPVQTSTLMALSVASFCVGMGYKVAYQNGSDCLPVGLFTLAEQPSGTGKSGALNKLSMGMKLGIEAENEKRKPTLSQLAKSKADKKGELDELEQKQLTDNHKIHTPVSNTTPEALDLLLNKQGGWFCLASTEQGLLNTLIGGMYSEGKSNFDLMLKGFNSEYHSEMRVTREAYTGQPHGGCMCVSQDGSITTVLNNSGSTGLVERFLMIIEGDMRGYRTFDRSKTGNGQATREFNNRCREIIESSFPAPRSMAFKNLQTVTLSNAGWTSLNKYRRENEPNLKAGGKFSANIFSSMWSKFDIQVMKVSATIHMMSRQDRSLEVPVDIVNIAMGIVIEIFNGVVDICLQKGIVGKSVEEQDAESYMSKNCKGTGKREKEILDSLRKRKVFMQYGNDARTRAKAALDVLLAKGLVVEIKQGQITRYKTA